MRSNRWEEPKLDREYYDQLRKAAVEVFGNNEEEEGEEDQDPEVKDEDDGKDSSGGDDDDHLEYETLVDVCGVKIGLSSDDEQTLQKARLSLAGFFNHYITPS